VGNRQDLSETLIGRKLSIRQFTEKLLLYRKSKQLFIETAIFMTEINCKKAPPLKEGRHGQSMQTQTANRMPV
jgi:hypothetical protein